MTRRYVLVAFAVALLAGAGLVGRAIRSDDAPFTIAGDVQMVTSPDGLTTAISIDVGNSKYPPDGIVDHAFRLQHKAAQALAYNGLATISYADGQLILETGDDAGWVFTVEGIVTPVNDRILPHAWLTVTGLSHHWGTKIHRSHEDVATLLLGTGCMTLDGGDPTCENCGAGGPGAEGCGIECEDESGCSVNCSPGSFACCSCPGTCRCCKDKEIILSGRPLPH